MATQIFVEPELETLHENAEEWQALCTELGLDKQLSKSGTVERVGNPYMKIDPRSERVYEMLCPVKVDYSNYVASTLPIDVLQEIKRCKENNWFKKIQVWFDDKSPDPFLIGYEWADSESEWQARKFLIARWGDELLPFEQLMAKAINRFKDAYRRALNKLVMDCEARKKDVEGDIQDYINRGAAWNGFEFPKFENPIA